MFNRNMTGDPNHQNRPTIFGFDPYPSSSLGNIDWTQSVQCPQSFSPLQISSTPNIVPQNFQQPSELGNFSFGNIGRPTNPVVQFPFQINNNDGFGARPAHQPVRCKRKTDSPPLQTCKQHITEEKMAEHMSKLHISSETATSTKEPESVRTQRLYMCEEMRKLQSESILPHSLLSRIQRPCTALVLWTPPARLVPPANNVLEENENNNEENIPDNNRMENMDMESI